jgi:hypothetical protein
MSLPNTLPGVRSSALVRLRYRKRAQNAHGEDLLRILAHVARYGFHQTVWQWRGRTTPVSGHSAHSMHNETYPDGRGKAFDTFGRPQDMAAFAAWCDQYAPQLDELIHNPNASRKNGRRVAPSFWGSQTWAAHVNHVHVGNDGRPS